MTLHALFFASIITLGVGLWNVALSRATPVGEVAFTIPVALGLLGIGAALWLQHQGVK